MGLPPHITAQYDAELFGHWWFEGPAFLEMFLRKAHGDQQEIQLLHPSEYLRREPVHQVAEPAFSSWGARGYYEVWLNETNDWIYRHLHRAEERMVELCMRFPRAEGDLGRALRQAGRELLLAQASDWAFIMTMGTTVPYAERRTREHLTRFNRLCDEILGDRLDLAFLSEIESLDTIFQEIDPMAWHPDRARVKGAGGAVRSVSLN
jgi:1,4-alpha-glucan branching enzyme